MKFKRYTYGTDPNLLPLDKPADDNRDYNAWCLAAGFDPDDEEMRAFRLSREWNGYPADSVVLTGPTWEGHPFAVEIPTYSMSRVDQEEGVRWIRRDRDGAVVARTNSDPRLEGVTIQEMIDHPSVGRIVAEGEVMVRSPEDLR
jgi:hypothetical protein